MESIKILLADDHEGLRSALRFWLEGQPFVEGVEEATEVQSLLAKIETTIPDVLLFEWEIPGLESYGGSHQLLHNLRLIVPSLKVIALSLCPEVKMSALDAGVDAFVNKRSPPEHLFEAFEQIIGDIRI